MHANTISEETVALINRLVDHTKPITQCKDALTQEEFRRKTIWELHFLSRKQGRSWNSFKDIPIGASTRDFFLCDLRNEIMTQERQEEELRQTSRILCIGCSRTQGGKTPLCIGHMVRLAWHAKHPDKPRYYGDPRWDDQ